MFIFASFLLDVEVSVQVSSSRAGTSKSQLRDGGFELSGEGIL